MEKEKTGRRVYVLSTSLHEGSNSEILARAFARGAQEAGNEVTVETLRGKQIGFCHGCYQCGASDCCVQPDDVPPIIDAIRHVDVVVFATPTYFYGMSAQMKAILDRTTPFYGKPHQFTDVYLLVTSGEDSPQVAQRVATGLEGWVECCNGAKLRGMVHGGGLNEAGAAHGSVAEQQAYEMGLKA